MCAHVGRGLTSKRYMARNVIGPEPLSESPTWTAAALTHGVMHGPPFQTNTEVLQAFLTRSRTRVCNASYKYALSTSCQGGNINGVTHRELKITLFHRMAPIAMITYTWTWTARTRARPLMAHRVRSCQLQ